jgi:hydroxyacylglutathione hydrolase
MHIIQLPIGLLGANCYLVYDREGGEAAIVDPGMRDPQQLLDQIARLALRVQVILNTHGHFDHVAGNGLLEFPNADLGIHPADRALLMQGGGARQFGFMPPASPPPTLALVDGKQLTLGSETIEIIHTPGHTPGCVCFYIPAVPAVLTGDTLFAGSVGRTDLTGGSQRELEASLRRLMRLPSETRLYPGHGPATSLSVEKRNNPWLKVLNQT